MLIKSEGIVLRTTDYGETNKIVTLLTREHGKIGVMARGAKKSNSRLSAISQPFLYGTFLIQSSTGLGTLQQGEMMESMRTIREDLFLTAYAAYMTELLDKGTEEKKPNPYLFELLLQSLRHLNEGTDADIILFIVEVKMLSVMGLKPELDQCVHCGQKKGSSISQLEITDSSVSNAFLKIHINCPYPQQQQDCSVCFIILIYQGLVRLT